MMNPTDLRLKQDVEAEFRWNPKINAADCGVAVDNGAISLASVVDTYAEPDPTPFETSMRSTPR